MDDKKFNCVDLNYFDELFLMNILNLVIYACNRI